MAAGGMTISAFAKAGGVGVETVRCYQRLDRTKDRLRIQTLAAGKLAELRGQIRGLRSVARSLEQLLEHCRHAPAGERCPIVEAFDP
jgi:hypothetical protein